MLLCDLQFETYALQLKWTVQNDGFEVYCYVDYISQKIPEPWQFNYIALAHEFRVCKYAFDLQHFSFGLQLSSSSLLVIILGLTGIGIDFQFNPFALQLDWTCQYDGFEVCWYGLHLHQISISVYSSIRQPWVMGLLVICWYGFDLQIGLQLNFLPLGDCIRIGW